MKLQLGLSFHLIDAKKALRPTGNCVAYCGGLWRGTVS